MVRRDRKHKKMATEFIERRHEHPDYELDINITGVKLGDTEKVNWKILVDQGIDAELVAEILDQAAIVLRGTAHDEKGQ